MNDESDIPDAQSHFAMREAHVVKRLIFILAALHALAFIDRTIIGGVLPLLRQSIAMSDAQAGWIVGTAFALPYGLTALIAATLPRGQRRSTAWLAGGVLLWTSGSVATGLAGSLSALTLGRAALGVGQGLFVPTAIARLLDSSGPAERSRALGLFTGAASFGRSTALLIAGVLLPALALIVPGGTIGAWRWLFVVTAVPNLFVLVALGRMHAQVIAVGSDANGRDSNVPWRTLLPLFPVAVGPMLLVQAVLTWLPTLMVRERGLSTASAALFVGAITLIAAPSGPVIAGWLIGRHRAWERHVPILVLLALAAAVPLLVGVVWLPGLTAAGASMAAMLIVLGMANFGGLFGVQLLVPPNARIRVNGVFLSFITMVGFGLGPLVTGVLTSMTQGGGTPVGTALVITSGTAVLLCALTVAGARRPFALGIRQ